MIPGENKSEGSPRKVKFESFLEKFPEVTLPVTLGESTHHEFSLQNEPLNQIMIDQYIALYDENEADEFTEFIACFRFPKTEGFHALVFWRAGLMDYRYVLATYNKRGEMIAQRIIAGTFSDGKKITQSVATIDEDWTIGVASGQSDAVSGAFDATASTTFSLELMPDGSIENVI